ncbi:MAG: carbon starvation protein A [Gammaproteobacteria bacterium]|nr:MAG: carbon starvation protein A [Gammaproteobacteria bacterium]
MNILLIVVVSAIIFIFGYRFYAKLLLLGVFRPPAQTAERDTVTHELKHHHHPGITLGHHLGMLLTASTFTGVGVALYWGWMPAFLWILSASVIAGACYAMGSFWLTQQDSARSLGEWAGSELGQHWREPVFVLVIIVLAITASILLALATHILSQYHGTILGFTIFLWVAWQLGRHWNRHGEQTPFKATTLAMILILSGMALSNLLPLALTGVVQVNVAGNKLLTLNATIIWAVLLLVAAAFSLRKPVRRVLRPQSYLAASLAGLLGVATLLALVLQNPEFTAPEFGLLAGKKGWAPGAFPWLFLTLSSGAIAGFHLLVIRGISSRYVTGPASARRFGYGGALLEAGFALVILMVFATTFTDGDAWKQGHEDWGYLTNLPAIIDTLIRGWSQRLTGLGLGKDFATILVAVSLLVLMTTTLDTCLRLLRQTLSRLACFRLQTALGTEKRVFRASLLCIIVPAFWDLSGTGGLSLWTGYGPAQALLAVVGLAVLASRVPQQGLARFILAPAAVLAVLLAWGLGDCIYRSYLDGRWAALAAALFGLTLLLGLLILWIQRARGRKHLATGA